MIALPLFVLAAVGAGVSKALGGLRETVAVRRY